jgi:hypothetical protein
LDPWRGAHDGGMVAALKAKGGMHATAR